MKFTCPTPVYPKNYGRYTTIEADNYEAAQEKLCRSCPGRDKCKGLEADVQPVKVTPGQMGLFET